MCVHTRHCTYRCCKYGEEDFCPVYLGYKEPEITTEEDGQVIEKPNDEEFELRQEHAEQFQTDQEE